MTLREAGKLSMEPEEPQTVTGSTFTGDGRITRPDSCRENDKLCGFRDTASVYAKTHAPVGRRLADGFRMMRGGW